MAPSFKLVVGSHVNYGLALRYMLESLRAVQYPMKDVLVIIAGADSERVEEKGEDQETFLYSEINAYDGTHCAIIQKHLDHPRVAADVYVNVHDCCVAMRGFPQKVKEMAERLVTENLDVLYACKNRKLGLAALSRGFYERFGHLYNRNMPKTALWDAEEQRAGSLAYSLLAGEEKTSQLDAEYGYGPGSKVYGSDIIRHPIFISSLHLQKFVANNDDINPPWYERARP